LKSANNHKKAKKQGRNKTGKTGLKVAKLEKYAGETKKFAQIFAKKRAKNRHYLKSAVGKLGGKPCLYYDTERSRSQWG